MELAQTTSVQFIGYIKGISNDCPDARLDDGIHLTRSPNLFNKLIRASKDDNA
jgi:hypothetical protein